MAEHQATAEKSDGGRSPRSVAIAFFTKDRVELSKRSVEPLLSSLPYDLWWIDGSTSAAGQALPEQYFFIGHVRKDIRGGGDHALVYALTTLLDAGYDYIGFVENDVLLPEDWFSRNMQLFELGAADGLKVGAASMRCYEDRILVQRKDYALMHNLGAGQVIFTREAAKILLKHYRNPFCLENRKVFAQLCNIDIGNYWAFQQSEHWLTVDWGFDKILAAHGLASVAATPSPVEMIGQDPPLDKQGLVLARKPVESRCHAPAFKFYTTQQSLIRQGEASLCPDELYQDTMGNWMIFPHQLHGLLEPVYTGSWGVKWSNGFGPFSYVAMEAGAGFELCIFGACSILVGGSKTGGRIEITDTYSGFKLVPQLEPEGRTPRILAIEIPAGFVYRPITLKALEPGPVFYGLTCREAQPRDPTFSFDFSILPGVAT
jgi:hypothetical protein